MGPRNSIQFLVPSMGTNKYYNQTAFMTIHYFYNILETYVQTELTFNRTSLKKIYLKYLTLFDFLKGKYTEKCN